MMKKVVAKVVLMGCFLTVGGNAIGSLVNPGFETDGGWNYTVTNSYDTVSRSVYAAHEGEYGLSAGTAVGWLDSINYVVASQDVAVNGGGDYTLSAWQKSVTQFAWMTLKLAWYDADKNLLSATQADFGDSTNFDWELRSMTKTAPETAASAQVSVVAVLHPWAERTVQIDDVAFVPEPVSLLLIAVGGLGLMKRRLPASI